MVSHILFFSAPRNMIGRNKCETPIHTNHLLSDLRCWSKSVICETKGHPGPYKEQTIMRVERHLCLSYGDTEGSVESPCQTAHLLVGPEQHADWAVGGLQAHAAVVLALLLQVGGPVLPQLGQGLGPALSRLWALVLLSNILCCLWNTPFTPQTYTTLALIKICCRDNKNFSMMAIYYL